MDAIDHEVTPTPDEEIEEQEEQTEEEEIETDQTVESTTGTINPDTEISGESSAPSDEPSSESSNPSPEPDENGGSVGGDEDIPSDTGTGGINPTDGVGEGKPTWTNSFEISNPDADIPQVTSIAAFGDYALIVQMIGGDGALGATDATTLNALSSNGVAVSAASVIDDSSSAYNTIDVEALVASGVEAILVEDTTAFATALSTDQYNYINEAGITVAGLRLMNTSSNIKTNVDTVGQMLQGSDVAAYGTEAQSRADYYVQLHDNSVKAANGGLASNTVTGTDRALQYQGDADGLGFTGAATYTVLIDYWDAGASASGASYPFSPGVAYASIGYATSPISYYIQAGGSINNAAALSTEISTGETPVLQFNASWNSPQFWSNTTLSNIVYLNSVLLSSGVDFSQTTNLGKGLGSDAMPKIIVTSNSIKDSILANSADANGLYHAYPYVGSGQLTDSLGVTNGDIVIWSCIGSDGVSRPAGDPNPIYPSGTISSDSIVVNPQGQFCDWISGSVESFLESEWVAAAVNGTFSYSQWEQDVRDFYSWAWGISANMNQIENPS
ncbi:MAG: hypothetical protein LUB61_03310 [Eggerthellaceae bacterium]|nr:hypothetical protein [Eggerthellaceae bacterium]